VELGELSQSAVECLRAHVDSRAAITAFRRHARSPVA
jgi:hypothetical protein